jgi:hypothetical protein
VPTFSKNAVIVGVIVTLGVLFLINKTPAGKFLKPIVGA